MDFKSFSEESFDPVQWINAAFQASDGDSSKSKESVASSLLYKLQLFVQEINGSLEEASQQVIHRLPQVLKSSEDLEQESQDLQNELHHVKSLLEGVDRGSGEALMRLKVLNDQKEKLESTSDENQQTD